MRLLPLIAATYFMVSGGPYGLEDIIGKAGYGRALLLLLIIPLLWSLPTSLMVGELASALPEEGGYYCWVRRALGRFWGFQEAWLSLAASVFDMAIYPTIFVLYLGRIAPLWTAGYRGTLWALAVVLLCTLWNLRGAAVVGEGSVGMFALLLAPFAVLIAASLWKALTAAHARTRDRPDAAHPPSATTSPEPSPSPSGTTWAGTTPPPSPRRSNTRSATIPAPCSSPPRSSPSPTSCRSPPSASPESPPASSPPEPGPTPPAPSSAPSARLSPSSSADSSTAPACSTPSCSATPASPTRSPKTACCPNPSPAPTAAGVPWVSVLLCAVAWALALNLSFERLISIDLVLYGAALILEFVALVVLRLREPSLPRPFKIPGGIAGRHRLRRRPRAAHRLRPLGRPRQSASAPSPPSASPQPSQSPARSSTSSPAHAKSAAA